ncbi:DUF2961 domain-containing protein [Dokdonella sp.]|uniref:DUF2961 domain-containing protein n=1 Tax=Dokdonella sp. TaxID=2291710 RepID=UPI002F40A4D9
MTRRLLAIACAGFAGAVARATGLPWEVWEAPSRLAAIDPGDSVLERSSHCLDGCRYDRSNAGSEGVDANPYPRRWLYRDGDEAVVLDERGPGALTRWWLTTGFGASTCIDPAIRVRVRLDGAAQPALDAPLAALFDGSTEPFTPPLAYDRLQSSGGFVSHVPIAYAHGLRIGLTGTDDGGDNPCTGNPQRLLWFQLQHHRVVPGTAVTSFVAGHDEPAWRAFLAHAGDDPWHAMLSSLTATTQLAPGERAVLATRSGPGWLRGIRLRLPRAAYAGLQLQVGVDGAPAIDMPVADFFASPADAQAPARGVLVGEDAGGWLYAWFPIPFADGIEIALAADAALAAPVAVDSALAFDAAPVPADAGRFEARLSDACSAASALVLDRASGAGKIVGVAARYRTVGPPTRGYLEGDERAGTDGAIAPAWYGTGVEDFFEGGFYFDRGAFAGPLAGATIVDADGSGSTYAYRLMPAAPLTYTSSLQFEQEAGYAPSSTVPTCIRSVVYAYRRDVPALVGYDAFEIGDAPAAAAHDYALPATAICAPLASRFEDEPPTARTARVCAYGDGASRFRFHVADARPPLRLRRTFDAGRGIPGETAGSAAATVFVNGAAAGAFAPAPANPERRWQQQEALLDVAAGTTDFEIVVEPEFRAYANVFAESRWELRGGWKDAIFADGCEATAPQATAIRR